MSRVSAGSRVDEIVRSALDLLDEVGLEAVSLRAVAARLDVRMNTVLWHVKTKARLRDLMADAILAEMSLDRLPEHWRDRVLELARRYRGVLLAHRDGGMVVAGTFPPEPATLAVAEAFVSALLAGGLEVKEAGWTCWSIVYFTLGLVQEEQGDTGPMSDEMGSAISPETHPTLSRVLPQLTDSDFGSRFEFGLARLLPA